MLDFGSDTRNDSHTHSVYYEGETGFVAYFTSARKANALANYLRNQTPDYWVEVISL